MTNPFGPIASMDYGNGLARSYSYDGDYRLTALATGDVDTSVQDLAYGYDAADNIASIADALASGHSQAFTYDSLFRLDTAAATGTYRSIADFGDTAVMGWAPSTPSPDFPQDMAAAKRSLDEITRRAHASRRFDDGSGGP